MKKESLPLFWGAFLFVNECRRQGSRSAHTALGVMDDNNLYYKSCNNVLENSEFTNIRGSYVKSQ
jgi:hypothetical protein